MKTKQTIFKAFASVALAMGAFAGADAQSNLGASCGCPAVASRTSINVSSLPGYVAIQGTFGGELTQGASFTCNNTYILDKKIYIPAGQTLTIAPGTVIKGAANLIAAEATALTIERGGKIMAMGTESCPIVFTAAADPMDGTYAISNVGKWGGVVLLGRATNNLTLAANGPFVPGGAGKLAVADGLGTVEGFASSNPQDQYGVATSIPVAYVSATSPATTSYTFDQQIASTATTNGVTTITLSGNGVYVLNGMPVSGSGIAPGTTVVSVSTNTVTLSGTQSGILTGTGNNASFTGTYPLAASTAGYFWAGTAGTGVTTNFTAGTGPVVGGTNFAIPFIGTAGGTFDDNDNSGVMKYVSIRHAGAILAVGAEINGLTLASVGRGTTIDHIEVVSCADDNIEVFGGTVNLKYVTMLFGNDDMFDYDLGWKGKAQFIFGMKSVTTSSPDSDNGIEADSDDNKSNLLPRTHPVIYNATLLGNAKTTLNSDNTSLAAINAKELTEGEIYNSVFGGWKNGLNLIISAGSGAASTSARNYVTGGESWHNWTNIAGPASATAGNGSQSLKVICNTFVGVTNPITIANTAQTSGGAGLLGTNYTQFNVTDKNTIETTVPGFTYDFTIDPATNAVSVKNDVTPSPALSVVGCPTAPVDGFFEPAAYRGAFSSQAGQNWLSNWTYSKVLNATSGVAACPTDLNSDGITNVSDFLIFAPAFNTSCN